jgi:hypothetical protein
MALSLYTDQQQHLRRQQSNKITTATIDPDEVSNVLQQFANEYCQNNINISLCQKGNNSINVKTQFYTKTYNVDGTDSVTVILPNCLRRYQDYFGDGKIQSMLDFLYQFLSMNQQKLLLQTQQYNFSPALCQKFGLPLFITFDDDNVKKEIDFTMNTIVDEKSVRRQTLPFDEPNLDLPINNCDDGGSTVLSLYTTEQSIGFLSHVEMVGGVQYNCTNIFDNKHVTNAQQRQCIPSYTKPDDDIQLSVLFNEEKFAEHTVDTTIVDAAQKSPPTPPTSSYHASMLDAERLERWQRMYNIPVIDQSNIVYSKSHPQRLTRSLSYY